MSAPHPKFIALIATCNRPQLLAKRALPSVAVQTRQPDLLIVADDSAQRFRARNQQAVAAFSRQYSIPALYLSNLRAKGASGAWNTGALTALSKTPDINNTYLAILDDDDQWLPQHIQQAEKALCRQRGADLLAAAFERQEAKRRLVITPPLSFNGRDFLTGNPGVGGSTLIIRMNAFFRAGAFDESLPACTDRDLCFRLSLLPDLAYIPLLQPAVVHYADSRRQRLSNPGQLKAEALARFADKYHGWMQKDEYTAFRRQAQRRFNWDGKKPARIKPPTIAIPRTNKHDEKISLVIGIIVAPADKDNPLFTDIIKLAKDKRLSSLDVVVMPESDKHRSAFRNEIDKWRQAGLRMYGISDIPADWHDFFADGTLQGTRSIAINRTILQHAMAALVQSYKNPVCWILDGDNRLQGLKLSGNKTAVFHPDYIGQMIDLRNAGYDAAIGEITGAAPLPRALTVRSQMVDLLHMLGRRQVAETDRHQPLSLAGDASIAGDYYHDCLPQLCLERPIGLSPPASNKAFRRQLPFLLDRILAGNAVTRPLVATGSVPRHLHRGGNTLVFNPAMLHHYPNGWVRGALHNSRRGDEIWRILSEKVSGYRIHGGFFPVTQSRHHEQAQAPDINRITADIAGHALTCALTKINKAPNTIELFISSVLQNRDFIKQVQQHAEQRLNMLRASFLRIGGAAASMRALLRQESGSETTIAYLRKIERDFSAKPFARIQKQTRDLLNPAVLEKSLADFPEICRHFADMREIWHSWIKKARRANAAALLAQRQISDLPLRFLGQGSEGSVFTDGQHVFKVLHRWYSSLYVADTNFLPSLAQKWQAGGAMFPVQEIIQDSGDLLLKIPFEKTTPYTGGHGAELVALLKEIKQHRLTYWNFKPGNLRCSKDKVHLIDYGIAIRPFTKHAFDLSLRKAWLCCYYPWRRDWKKLGTESLTNPDLPELAGYQNLKFAVEQYATRARAKDQVMHALSPLPDRILDYGCGKGKDAIKLAEKGARVTAFDPALTADEKKRLRAAGVRTVTDIKKEAGLYGAVLLRHVICEIKSDKALRDCLRHAYRLLRPDGKLIITACATAALAKDTLFARHALPARAAADKKFTYQKHLRAMDTTRAHVYRPEFILRREFARAGFAVTSRREFLDMDLQRFEYCTGTVQWTLRPLPPRPAVSLLIRACMMDAADAETQTRHLIEALNEPRGFAEIIFLIDQKTDNFLREHARGNLPALIAAAKRMQRRGWIDQIVITPTQPAEVRRLNQKWLGLDGAFTHARNGAPLSIVFAGFEKCRTSYALHIDIDMIAGRLSPGFDYLGKMLQLMNRRNAFTMALDLAGADSTLKECAANPYRLEVRAGLTDIKRLKSMLPLSAETLQSIPTKGWHRAADTAIIKNQLPSLRGGGQKCFVLHRPNNLKHFSDAQDTVIAAAQRGYCPARYASINEWDGADKEWLPPKRHEPFIFIVCGRNVAEGRMRRCLESITRQRGGQWGAVIMDDASGPSCAAMLRRWAETRGNVTYFPRRHQVGGLANLAYAVRRLCADPESVIITLDMDDALIGSMVLTRLQKEYDNGADVTIGSMLRTDKVTPDYPVTLQNPRAHRGGNVWQHLRSFKKRLFDAIPDFALHAKNGEYFNMAADWAYMLPIVEMAAKPVWIKDKLYLYDPDPRQRAAIRNTRDKNIQEIISRPPFSPKDKK